MASPAFTPILEAMTTGSTGFQLVRLGDEELFVAYSPLENTAWSLANVVRAANMLEAVATLQQNLESSTQTLTVTRILPVGAAILVVALALGLLLTNRLVNPLQKLAMAAQRVGAGEWEAEIPAGGENEVGLVARSFRTMTAQLRDLVSGLEERVSERTQELERRATYLETAATVARDATVMLDPEQLLTRVARQISDRFGFYQVGIFLLDPSGEWAVIAAASSPGGQRMVSRGHRLKVGAEGIVGYVTSTGQPRIALDVGGDAVYFDNPDLPDTRSEMALPLQARGEIIGALDVQSVEEAAFSAEDIAVLQTLADQVALAISNARLYQQSQANLEAIQQAYGEQSRQAWTTMAQTERVQAYRYTQGRVLPADDVWRPEMESALQFGQAMAGPARDEAAESATVALPIQIRDQVIGVLDIRKGGGSEGWTQDEITMLQSLVDQLGVALEGARLYQDTQRRATQERIVGEITARMRESLDMETVLKTATDQIWGALGMSRVEIRLIPEETEE
jgi:GAF domain-containing protein/HAMP domain-containing protein